MPTMSAHASTAAAAARHFLEQKVHDQDADFDITVRASNAYPTPCRNPEPFLPGASMRLLGRITVGIRCSGSATRYLQARILATGRYWVAARNIDAGTLLTAAMLKACRGNLNQLPHGSIRKRAAAIGKVATRHLDEGTVLMQSQLRAPWLVHQGHTVTVVASGPGFRISRKGRALQNGALHATVRLRMSNRSILDGTVVAPGRVQVVP